MESGRLRRRGQSRRRQAQRPQLSVVRGGGSAAAGLTEARKVTSRGTEGAMLGSTAGRSTAAAPRTPGMQATAQSGVQQPIFS